MTVILGRTTLAAVLVLGLSGAGLAREAAPEHRGMRTTSTHHRLGLAAPTFKTDVRTTRDQPYTWPVSDRYRPVSQPYYGQAY